MEERRRSHLVVTIARTMGAGGSFVGKRLASRLGCRYLDREILLEAARRLNRDAEALEAYDERHMSFWERTRMAYALGTPEAPYAPPPLSMDDMDLFETQKTIILEAAARGPCVIVGRAGSWVLREERGLLSTFFHAPLERRVARIRKIYNLGTDGEARELIAQSDREREQFVKAVTGHDWKDPKYYHLCVDTWRVGTGTAIELVYSAAMEVARNLLQTPEDELF